MALLAEKQTARIRPSAGRLVTVAGVAAGILLGVMVIMAVEMFLMLQQLRHLESNLPTGAPSLNRLAAMQSDLDRMQPDLHEMNTNLRQIQTNTAAIDPSLKELSTQIQALNSELAQIAALLREVDQHVANIDRRTGPPPPAPIP